MDLRRFVQRFARKQRLLLDRLTRAEELADAIACDLADLERALVLDGAASGVTRVRPKRLRELLGKTVDVRVNEVSITRRADDWGLIHIDQADEFLLPPLLTDLLSVLISESGPSDDELVAWKTLDEVSKRLEKKVGRRFGRHAVTQQIHRLRRELFARGGVSPLLVQTSRRFGVRVAVRRRPRSWAA
jgi:hypothetical protein